MSDEQVVLLPGVLTCVICNDSCDTTTGKVSVAYRCGHMFHTRCIRNWWSAQCRNRVSRSCPTCNKEYDYEALLEVFPAIGSNVTIDALADKLNDLEDRNARLQTENDEQKIQLDAKTVQSNHYQSECLKLELELDFTKQALNLADERKGILERQVEEQKHTLQMLSDQLEARTEYFIKRLAEVTCPKIKVQRNVSELNLVDQNSPVDLSKRCVSRLGRVQHSPQASSRSQSQSRSLLQVPCTSRSRTPPVSASNIRNSVVNEGPSASSTSNGKRKTQGIRFRL